MLFDVSRFFLSKVPAYLRKVSFLGGAGNPEDCAADVGAAGCPEDCEASVSAWRSAVSALAVRRQRLAVSRQRPGCQPSALVPLGAAATGDAAAARGAARAWAARAWAATAAAGVDQCRQGHSLLNAGQNVREQLLRPVVSKGGDDHVHDDGCPRVGFRRDCALWRHCCGGRRLPRLGSNLDRAKSII